MTSFPSPTSPALRGGGGPSAISPGEGGREAVVGSRFLVEHQLCQDFKLLAVFVEVDKPILLKTNNIDY